MSAVNYSKWDNLTLSDDSDTECHPNIDKKSFIKWKREALHKEREERQDNLKRMSINLDILKAAINKLKQDPSANMDALYKAIPKLEQDLLKLPKEQHLQEIERVYSLIQADFKELTKKEEADLSVDKVCHEGFSTTRVNLKKKPLNSSQKQEHQDDKENTTKTGKAFETVNKPGLVIVPDSLKNDNLLLGFVACASLESIYNYIQSNSEVVDAKNQETLLSASFEYAFGYGEKLKANNIKSVGIEHDKLFLDGLKRLVFNATFIQYSLQADPRLLYQKFSTIPAALKQFEDEVANTMKHIISRLTAKMNQPEDGHFFDLSPSAEKSEVLKKCPVTLKEAIIREDIDAFQKLLEELGDDESSKWLEEFVRVKLIELVAVDSQGNEIQEETEHIVENITEQQ